MARQVLLQVRCTRHELESWKAAAAPENLSAVVRRALAAELERLERECEAQAEAPANGAPTARAAIAELERFVASLRSSA